MTDHALTPMPPTLEQRRGLRRLLTAARRTAAEERARRQPGWRGLRRRGPRLAQLVSPGDVVDPDAGVEEIVMRELEARRLRLLLANLPSLERRVLQWRYGLDGDEISYRVIAMRLNVPQGSVWKLEQRGLEQLRTEFTDDESADERAA